LTNAQENLAEAAGELERAVGILRQEVADGTAPPSVQGLLVRLEQAAARARLEGRGDAAASQPGEPSERE
jgi:hypothetical protein